MPFCPVCRAEYRDGFKVCVDCKVALVSEPPNLDEVGVAKNDTKPSSQQYERLLAKGEEAFDREDYKKALEALNSATQLNADDPHAWNLLGLTYQALGHEREAWRSFKFSLRADQDDTHALWYAACFLFEQEDFPMAMAFVTRYLEVETDATELAEAEQLKKDISYHLRSLEELNAGAKTPGDEYDDTEVPAEEVPADQFILLDEEGKVEDAEDYVEEEEEIVPPEAEYFEADLHLMLTDRSSKCLSCGTALPTDAPYCYNCKEPHLYRPL